MDLLLDARYPPYTPGKGLYLRTLVYKWVWPLRLHNSSGQALVFIGVIIPMVLLLAWVGVMGDLTLLRPWIDQLESGIKRLV